jgi:hypothetical protein
MYVQYIFILQGLYLERMFSTGPLPSHSCMLNICEKSVNNHRAIQGFHTYYATIQIRYCYISNLDKKTR